MPIAPNRAVQSISLPADAAEAVDKLAAELNYSKQGLWRTALEFYVNNLSELSADGQQAVEAINRWNASGRMFGTRLSTRR